MLNYVLSSYSSKYKDYKKEDIILERYTFLEYK